MISTAHAHENFSDTAMDAFIFRFGEKVTHCETCQPQFMSHCSSFLLGSCEDKAIIFLGWETDNKDRWSR